MFWFLCASLTSWSRPVQLSAVSNCIFSVRWGTWPPNLWCDLQSDFSCVCYLTNLAVEQVSWYIDQIHLCATAGDMRTNRNRPALTGTWGLWAKWRSGLVPGVPTGRKKKSEQDVLCAREKECLELLDQEWGDISHDTIAIISWSTSFVLRRVPWNAKPVGRPCGSEGHRWRKALSPAGNHTAHTSEPLEKWTRCPNVVSWLDLSDLWPKF